MVSASSFFSLPFSASRSFSRLTSETELLSNLVFEGFGSCGDLVRFGFNSVFERDACDDFGEVVKAA